MDKLFSSLGKFIKTGNVMLDTILVAIITLVIEAITANSDKIIKYIQSKRKKEKKKIKSEYLVQGRVTASSEYCFHNTYFPDEYKAIMYKLNCMGIDIKYGKQFNITNLYGTTLDINYNFCYSINTKDEIKMNKDLYVRQENKYNKSNDLKASMEVYGLYLYSYTLTYAEIIEYVNKWRKEYKSYIKQYTDGNYYYFTYIGNKKKNDDSKLKFESYLFESNKTFDNIFFENKDKLLNRIKYFMENKEKYSKLGIPYTLGLLFHGFPGCGKTSCIKAISNLTKRHIVEIPLSKISSCDELRKIFLADTINGYYVPYHKKIIVLEDIDCMTHIVKKRGKSDVNNIIDSINKDNEMTILKEQFINRYIKKNSTDDLNLSYILNLIDGVLEQPGRIMIITSNYPDRLDDALIRPGRIDKKVNFRKCNNKIISDILSFYFNEKIVITDAEEYIYTPADIIEKCININDKEEVIDLITKNNKNIV